MNNKIRALCVGVILILVSTGAAAQSGGVQIELNKLKPVDNACRAYFVTQNLTKRTFSSLKLDVVMFDNNGIVAKRLAVQIAPIEPNRTRLKVFDIDKVKCQDLGQFLLNGVLECKAEKGAVKNCQSLVSVTARGSVSFIQ